MSTTNSRNYKMKYIILLIVILLIIIATICYFIFFKGDGSKPPHTDNTTYGKTDNDIESENNMSEEVSSNDESQSEKAKIFSTLKKYVENKSFGDKNDTFNEIPKSVRKPHINIEEGNTKDESNNRNDKIQKFKIQDQASEVSKNSSVYNEERLRQQKSVNDKIFEKIPDKIAEKISDEDSQTFEYLHTSEIIEKVYTCLRELKEDIHKVPEIKFSNDLLNFIHKDVKSALESLKKRKMVNQKIQSPNCPIMLDIKEIETSFMKNIWDIYENYIIKHSDSVSATGLDFLNNDHFHQIIIDENINMSTDLQDLKKPQYRDIPFSMLIHLEISLFVMKVDCLNYSLNWVNRDLAIIKSFCLSYKDLMNNEKDEGQKKLLEMSYNKIQNDPDIKDLLTLGNNLMKELDEYLKDTKEILERLKKLRNFIVSDDSENQW